mmetsp:Transcript_36770/g.54019  ORF Transcript_36770/g.54019 Transcript_36770/m.54019 type:complete len:222 (-) Transcript_36770:56-721(-)
MPLLQQLRGTGRLDFPVSLRIVEWRNHNEDHGDNNLPARDEGNDPTCLLHYSPKLVIPYNSVLGRSLLWLIFCWEMFIKAFCVWFILISIPFSIAGQHYFTYRVPICEEMNQDSKMIRSCSDRAQSEVRRTRAFRVGKRGLKLKKIGTEREISEIRLRNENNSYATTKLRSCSEEENDGICYGMPSSIMPFLTLEHGDTDDVCTLDANEKLSIFGEDAAIN